MAQKNLQRKLGLTTLVWDRDRGCSIPEPNQQEAQKELRHVMPSHGASERKSCMEALCPDREMGKVRKEK